MEKLNRSFSDIIKEDQQDDESHLASRSTNTSSFKEFDEEDAEDIEVEAAELKKRVTEIRNTVVKNKKTKKVTLLHPVNEESDGCESNRTEYLKAIKTAHFRMKFAISSK